MRTTERQETENMYQILSWAPEFIYNGQVFLIYYTFSSSVKHPNFSQFWLCQTPHNQNDSFLDSSGHIVIFFLSFFILCVCMHVCVLNGMVFLVKTEANNDNLLCNPGKYVTIFCFLIIIITLNLGMDKGNLKISKHLLLQLNIIISDACYLMRIVHSHLAVYVCCWFMCLVHHFCCSYQFFFSWYRHIWTVFWHLTEKCS